MGRVQERIRGHLELEERIVSQAAARAVAIIYREAISCRSGEDQVLCPSIPDHCNECILTSLTIALM